jgi:hypothetical protein
MFFALSLYVYGTAYFFLPVFLLLSFIWLLRRNKIRNLNFIVAFTVFFIIALPITICNLRNMLGLGEFRLGIFSLPELTAPRQFQETIMSGGGILRALSNYADFFGLLLTQSDGLPYNAIEGFGLYYFFGLPLAALGLIAALGTRRDHPREAPILFAVISSLFTAFFVFTNINRFNMTFLPLIYFQALGLHFLLKKLKDFSIIPLAGILVCFGLFWNSYVSEFGGLEREESFFPGLGEAILFVEAQEPESVYITNYVMQPYIYVLFYTEMTPAYYSRSINFYNPGDPFEFAMSLDKYKFGWEQDAQCQYRIYHRSEYDGGEKIAEFGAFVVTRGGS